MKTLSIIDKNILSMIKNSKGRFFTVTHKRKKPKIEVLPNGEKVEHLYNTMTCRIDVIKHIKGTGKGLSDELKESGAVRVYKTATPQELKGLTESQKKRVIGYRTFYVSDVISLKIQNQYIRVER